jgi:hypothetical protein
MNEREYERLKRQIRQECAEKLKALETVWAMARNRKSDETNDIDSRKGEVLAMVKEAIKDLHGPFTQREIRTALAHMNPDVKLKRASVSSALRRLAQDGTIMVLETGKGKRSTKYIPA